MGSEGVICIYISYLWQSVMARSVILERTVLSELDSSSSSHGRTGLEVLIIDTRASRARLANINTRSNRVRCYHLALEYLAILSFLSYWDMQNAGVHIATFELKL